MTGAGPFSSFFSSLASAALASAGFAAAPFAASSLFGSSFYASSFFGSSTSFFGARSEGTSRRRAIAAICEVLA